MESEDEFRSAFFDFWLDEMGKTRSECERHQFLLGLNIYNLNKNIVEATTQVAKFHNLTLAEYRTMLFLRPSYPNAKLTPGTLMSLTQTTSGGMAKILRELEARNLITRHPNPNDARSNMVSLTDNGRKVFDESFSRAWQSNIEMFASALDQDEINQLFKLLTKVLDNNKNRPAQKPLTNGHPTP